MSDFVSEASVEYSELKSVTKSCTDDNALEESWPTFTVAGTPPVGAVSVTVTPVTGVIVFELEYWVAPPLMLYCAFVPSDCVAPTSPSFASRSPPLPSSARVISMEPSLVWLRLTVSVTGS